MLLKELERTGYEYDGARDCIIGPDGSVFEYVLYDGMDEYFVRPEKDGSVVPVTNFGNEDISDGRSVVIIKSRSDRFLGDMERLLVDDYIQARKFYKDICEDSIRGSSTLPIDGCSQKFTEEISDRRKACSSIWQTYEENTLPERNLRGELSDNEITVLGVLRSEGFRCLHDGDGSIIFKPEALYRSPDGGERDFTDIYPEFRISYDGNDTPDTWIARVKEAIEDCTDRVYRNFADAGYPNPYGISPDAPEFKELDALYAQIGHTLDEQIITLPKKVEEAFLKQTSGLPSDSDPYGDCDEYGHKPGDSGTEPDRDWSRTHWVRRSSTESEPDALETSESNPWKPFYPDSDEEQHSLDDDDFPGYVLPEPWIPNFEPWNPSFEPQR